MAPLIGITSSYVPAEDGKFGTISVSESYIQAVIKAGGLPVVIPVGLDKQEIEELFGRLDGLLLTGGADVDPARFGGLPHPRVYGIDDRRDALEIQLTQLAVEREKPFMGICRGIQVINVALGGTLYTDIADHKENALRHDWFPNVPRDYLAHSVSLEGDSRLARILGGSSCAVNSLHHQGLLMIAPALKPVAFSPDALVEAVEIPGHPFGLGVQWHPEWLQEHVPQRQLFQALVRAAEQR